MDVAWTVLVLAGLMEPCWVYTMERSEHFRRPAFALATVLLIVADLSLLSVAMQTIGAGVAYAVWAGIGAMVTLVMGVVLYGDPMSPARAFFAVLLVAGVVGLHLTTGGHRAWTGTPEDGPSCSSPDSRRWSGPPPWGCRTASGRSDGRW